MHACIHPSIHACMYASIHPSLYPSIHPFMHPSIHPSICLSIHPSIHPFIHPYTHASIYPSIHPSSPVLPGSPSFPSLGQEISRPLLLLCPTSAAMSLHLPTALPQASLHHRHPLPQPHPSEMPSLAGARVSCKCQNKFTFHSASQTSASSCSTEKLTPLPGGPGPTPLPPWGLFQSQHLFCLWMRAQWSSSTETLFLQAGSSTVRASPSLGACFSLHNSTEFVRTVMMAKIL